MLAPIALFTYNRPEHTAKVLETLANNAEAKDSVLFVFCDGVKETTDINNVEKINEVRNIVKNEKRFQRVVITLQDKNLGLANSIISGVSTILNDFESVIVVEDDLILSPYFLSFMNDSLIKYCDNLKVGQVGACNFFACGTKYPETFFLHIPDCWGWATWKNRWVLFNPDAIELLRLLKLDENKMFKFNANGAYDFQGMLEDQIDNKVNSWAIRWQATCVLNDLMTIYPNPSLTNHIASIHATHANMNITPPLANTKINNLESDLVINKKVLKAMKRGYSNTGNYYGNLKLNSLINRIRIGIISKIFVKIKKEIKRIVK